MVTDTQFTIIKAVLLTIALVVGTMGLTIILVECRYPKPIPKPSDINFIIADVGLPPVVSRRQSPVIASAWLNNTVDNLKAIKTTTGMVYINPRRFDKIVRHRNQVKFTFIETSDELCLGRDHHPRHLVKISQDCWTSAFSYA